MSDEVKTCKDCKHFIADGASRRGQCELKGAALISGDRKYLSDAWRRAKPAKRQSLRQVRA